MPEKRIMTELT